MSIATNLQSDDIEKSDSWSESSSDPKPRVQSAFRTISILLAISESSNGLRVKDITDKLGLSRQVTYHLIHTLHATGIIRKNENNRYVLGLAAVAIAEGFQRQLAPPEHLALRVRSIVAATEETAYAGGWVDGEIVALATAPGQSPVGAVQVPRGFSGYAHARATGKLLLALADPVVCAAYLEAHPRTARTAKTIIEHDDLMNEFELIRKRGYSLDDEEFHHGIRCLSVPVEGLGGRFALGISVPAERFEQYFDRYLAALTNAARANF
jgi:IclR family acetate operon transcriptional repressor